MKRLAQCLLLVTSLALPMAAAPAPIIFWIDNLYGVATATGAEGGNGIYLTIGGGYFGATNLGTTAVSVNGTNVAQVIYWSNDRIGVQIASGTTTGAVTVTTSNGTATGPTFTVRSGSGAGYRIFYVGPPTDNGGQGDKTNPTSNCTTVLTGSHAGTYADPFQFNMSVVSQTEGSYSYTTMRTPRTYFQCLSAGDSLVMLNGSAYPYWDGRGLHASLTVETSGTSGNPITLMTRPGAVAGLGGYASGTQVWAIRFNGTQSYLTFSGLSLEALAGEGTAWEGGTGQGVRVVNSSLECPSASSPSGCMSPGGGTGSGTTSNFVMYGSFVHNVSALLSGGAVKTQHAIYSECCLGGSTEFGWNRVWDTQAYNDIQFNSGAVNNPTLGFSNLSVHDNNLSDGWGIGINWSTVGFTDGTYVTAYNNVLHHLGVAKAPGGSGGDPHACIAMKGFSQDAAAGTITAYNNTMYDCSGYANINNANAVCAIFDVGTLPQGSNVNPGQPNINRQYINNIVDAPSYVNSSTINGFICGGITNAEQLGPMSNGVTSGNGMAGSTNNLWYTAAAFSSDLQAPTFGTVEGSPNVISESTGNFWIASGAPANGGGTNSLCPATDITGAPQTATCSVGAYIYQASPPVELASPQTTLASSITGSSAAAGGTVEYLGAGTITAVGTCWSTSPFPTVARHAGGGCTNDGTSTSFTSSLTVVPNTLYYYRSYVTVNSNNTPAADSEIGTNYGGLNNFTSGASMVPAPVTGLFASSRFLGSGLVSWFHKLSQGPRTIFTVVGF